MYPFSSHKKKSDLKYPKNEFNSNDSSISSPQFVDLKKEMKKDLKKEAILKEVQNESLKLLIKDAQKEAVIKSSPKDTLPQRDNSKATSQKEDKLEKMKNSNINREPHTPPPSKDTKDKVTKDTLPKDKVTKDTITKDQSSATDDSHLDLADLFIGTITNASTASTSKQSANTTSGSTVTGALDDLRIKVIEQVHLKAKIFFQVFSQAFNGNQLLRESVSAIKNKNDGLSNKINSIYSSTPYLRPFQANVRPPANSNSFCSSLAVSFQQYSQLNAFLLAAFLLFPVTIPFYLLGWLVLFLTRSLFCIGAKQIVTNIIYRIRSS